MKKSEKTIWTPANPQRINEAIATWKKKFESRMDFLGENPQLMNELYAGNDDFDPSEQAAWEKRERMAAALAIVKWFRALPDEEAARKLLGIFDERCSSVNKKPRKAGRPKRSIWDYIDEQTSPDENGRHHNSPKAADRAGQRCREKLGLQRPPGRPSSRQK